MRLIAVIAMLSAGGCADLSGLNDFSLPPAGGGQGSGGDGAAAQGGNGGATSNGGGPMGGSAAGCVPIDGGDFANIRRLDALSSASDDDDPTSTDDRMEVFFNSDRDGNDQIWTARRSSPEAPWSPTEPVDVINALGPLVSDPTITTDGLTMWVTASADGNPNEADVYVSTRVSRSAEWSVPVAVPELSFPSMLDGVGGVNADATIVITHHDSDARLHEARRPDPTAPWATPVILTELDDGENDAGAWLSADGLVLYWRRTSSVFRASRPSLDDDFTNVEAVQELAEPGGAESDPWLSCDHRYMMFAKGQSDQRDIFEASR